VSRRERSLPTAAPRDDAIWSRAQDATGRIEDQLMDDRRTADREMYSLEGAVGEPCKVAVCEAEPDPPRRIGDEVSGRRHLRRWPLVANAQIVDRNELPAGASRGDPDIPAGVFDDRSRHSDRLTVGLVDPAESAILIDGQRIVDADPEAALTIFEEGR